uniref:Nucleotide sugar transporter family protein n=1 Tax=Tetraselmis sp. GSL018 TaxID=582737 RepID=A0A061RCK0_9CHLO
MPPGKNAASKTFLPAEWYSLKKFKEPSESSKTVASLFFSVASSFLIVSCNKHLISDLGFEQATTLTGLHTAACVGFTRVAKSLGWVTNKPCPWRAILTFGITQGVSIGFLNLSLGFNSVGFYQMTKLAIIPCTVFLERVVYNKKFSQGVLVSIVILVMVRQNWRVCSPRPSPNRLLPAREQRPAILFCLDS